MTIGWGMAREGTGASAVMRENDRVLRISDLNTRWGKTYPESLAMLIRQGKTTEIEQRAMDEGLFSTDGVPLDAVSMVLPISEPERIVGIGLNFRAHARDLKVPVPEAPATFLKPRNSWALSGTTVRLPRISERVTAEGEIALIFGRDARNVTADTADSVIWGAVTVLDLTAEDILQKNPRFLTRAKGYDRFMVVSPWCVRFKPGDFDVIRHLLTRSSGGEQRAGATDDMIYSWRTLVEVITEEVAIGATTVLSTGTPGAVVVHHGEEVYAEAEGLFPVSFRGERSD